MRSFEMLTAIFNVLMLGWVIFAPNKSQRGLLVGFGASAVLVLIHGFSEGMRWHMIPIYVMTIVPIVIAALRYKFKPKEVRQGTSRIRTIMITVLAFIYCSIAVALPLLLPVFTFEKPKGPYSIGTVSYDWKDNRREEIYTSAPNDKRELMVQIWYPASSASKGERTPYVAYPDLFANGYSKALNMPKPLFTSIGLVKTHAVEGAALSDKEPEYPVLLFSHSLNGAKNQNTFEIEQLVSHGYIVVGIDHTYHSTTTVFPDGRVVHFVPQESNTIDYLDKLNDKWVEDATFVLNQIEELTQHDPDNRFTGRMDLERIGMFGHSFGGATTVQMLMKDSRIKAAINMDGGLYGKLRVPADGLKKPFLMMSADDTLTGTEKMSDEYIASQGTTRADLTKFFRDTFARQESVTAGGNYLMTIKNMKHMGFSDTYLMSPLYERMEGVDIRSAHRLINDYSLDFFNHYLKQQPFKKLEQSIGDHPEFTLQKG
ncbi:acetylhydrolase [Paenibacillus sp. UMB4589-SE434]|uniref:alpha/beta hydrolase family protein n=1 Tax=Paenibacillus sp. UMB4589-SE434 TaxID=3046314 RepID=UPI00254C47BD|nr:acetylhydrolase [Paenibacillus sp. UMB4589-SE434]MDK8181317.1 acetylhydrolase [Paenibacillus sp. UMB4589-SE434]